MAYKEVSSLDADVTVALGKRDKKTGKAYPKEAEGYYLGTRTVENKRGESKLHFLQTVNGNLGIWGTTDLNRKLGAVNPGCMVKIVSTGTKPTPNGDMYVYKVMVDSDNTIEVTEQSADSSASESYESSYDNEPSYNSDDEDSDDDDTDEAPLAAKASVDKVERTKALLNARKKV